MLSRFFVSEHWVRLTVFVWECWDWFCIWKIVIFSIFTTLIFTFCALWPELDVLPCNFIAWLVTVRCAWGLGVVRFLGILLVFMPAFILQWLSMSGLFYTICYSCRIANYSSIALTLRCSYATFSSHSMLKQLSSSRCAASISLRYTSCLCLISTRSLLPSSSFNTLIFLLKPSASTYLPERSHYFWLIMSSSLRILWRT